MCKEVLFSIIFLQINIGLLLQLSKPYVNFGESKKASVLWANLQDITAYMHYALFCYHNCRSYNCFWLCFCFECRQRRERVDQVACNIFILFSFAREHGGDWLAPLGFPIPSIVLDQPIMSFLCRLHTLSLSHTRQCSLFSLSPFTFLFSNFFHRHFVSQRFSASDFPNQTTVSTV